MKLNCLIIDDEPKAIEVLERYVLKIPFLQHIASFRDPLDAISFINERKIDLIFLDINMPNLTGLKIPSLLDKATGFIFTTAYPEHAIEGFTLDAIDYLLKPVVFERFLKAATKAHEYYLLKNQHEGQNLAMASKADENILFFKSGTQIFKVDAGDILYFEKESVYFMIHLKGGKRIIIRTNFAGLLDILPKGMFVRIHKSYIISLSKIEVISNDEVLINGVRIPISESYKVGFMELIKTR